MIHLSEEDLISQAYGEGDKGAVSAHLARCAECSRAYAALRGDLAEMKFMDPPKQDAFYGEKVWASLSDSLPTYKARKGNLLRVRPWKGLGFAAACVLLGACTFMGGRVWERKQAQSTAEKQPEQKQQRAPRRVVVVVLGDHLDRSERLLVELKHADTGKTEMVYPLREEAQSLLEANRICRQNAKRADDAALATALDRLDHLLQELANQPGGLNAVTLTRLQHEIDADGLLFDVRVLRSRLPNHPASSATKGAIL